MSEFDAYFPVPTRRRDRNSRPPITSGDTSRDVSSAIPISATTDEVDDLHNVSIIQCVRSVRIPVAENGAIVFDDNETRVDRKRAEEGRNGAVTLELPRGSVHHQGDHPARFRSLNHTLKYLSLIHISEPTRQAEISYAVF